MSHNMDMFDGAIWHQQPMLNTKVLPIPQRDLDCLPYEGRVLGMNPLENKLHGRFRRLLVLEDSKGFV